MRLNVEKYVEQENVHWPTEGKHILAQYDDESIIVYQAYNARIAASAIEHQNFHEIEQEYSMSRMTWIKTNFLWMMYRSGWAQKKNQERILAIRMKRTGFEKLIAEAVETYCPKDQNKDEWRAALITSNVRLQWDPDHMPNGNSHPTRRAIQIGLKGEALQDFSRNYVIDIEDITDFVLEQSLYASSEDNWDHLITPSERIYNRI